MSSPATKPKIVYCCYGGTHSSPVAAAIHLGWLPRDRVPTRDELMAVPFFDRMTSADRGRVMLAGVDALGREVFVLGRGAEARGIPAAVASGWALAGGAADGLVFVDTLRCVNWFMRIGGFLSRGAGWTRVGRPIVLYGTQRAYKALLRLVEKVEREVAPGRYRPPSPQPDPPAPAPVYP